MAVAAARVEGTRTGGPRQRRSGRSNVSAAFGRRTALTVATRNTTASRRRTHGAPRKPILRITTAGSEATKPVMAANTASRELAPTSSSSLVTVAGTTAALLTRYSFENTSTPKASGNSSRL